MLYALMNANLRKIRRTCVSRLDFRSPYALSGSLLLSYVRSRLGFPSFFPFRLIGWISAQQTYRADVQGKTVQDGNEFRCLDFPPSIAFSVRRLSHSRRARILRS